MRPRCAAETHPGPRAQAIALIARLLDSGDAGPHVIVAPVSTLENWARGLRKWCPKLRVVVYHGTEAERDEIREHDGTYFFAPGKLAGAEGVE